MTTEPFQLPGRGSTWVFAGDSITQGVFHTHGQRSWVELVHERIRWELDRLTDIVVNTGVSGWSAPEVSAEFEHLVARFAPAVVSISLGTNDAIAGPDGIDLFRRSLHELVERSVRLHARVILHTPVLTMADAPPARRPSLPTYADVIRSVAAGTDSILVDHQAHWHSVFGTAQPTAWMDDHSHPNAAGHRHLANLTLDTLGLGPLQERP